GIVTKTVGVYALIRLMYYVFGMSPAAQKILMFAGALSIVVGALAAITQKNFKKMLAYSSVSQMGYIILALGCGTTMAIIGAVFHLLNHAIFKSLLFVNSASVEKSLGTVDMEKMGGLGQKMPVTGFTSVIAFLSTAGIPPLSGFWSKLIIITALWTAGNTGYAALALVSSIITLGYFLSMQSMAFFGQVRNGLEDVKESGMGLAIPQAILAIVTIGIGLLFPVIYNLFLMPLGNILR
ncbi:MAG TPA: proton-conducting transporter membrane subunit, partial [Candidatus Omnitrophota bacterium]|nr:proton-conducting transporter membrane subunit [Candidatus Omnitrophota bacterium]